MTASPDVLHPLQAHFVIFEAALGIPHNPRIQQLLRAQRIPQNRYLAVETDPLPIEDLLSDQTRTEQLVEQYDRSLLEMFRTKKPRKSVDSMIFYTTLKQVYGREDGHIHTLEELGQQWYLRRAQVNQYRSYDLGEVLKSLEQRYSIKTSLVDSGKSRFALVSALRESLEI